MKKKRNPGEKETKWQRSGRKCGTKKDWMRLLEAGGHAKGTGTGGA